MTETEIGDGAAAYEVEIRRPDGSQVEVKLDDGFNVIGSAADDFRSLKAAKPRRCWYLIGYHYGMETAGMLRTARRRAGLTLRALAQRSLTSHTALAAYETGAKVPKADTLTRILRAAGFELELERAVPRDGGDPAARGRELVEVLELAARFPSRHDRALPYPRFGLRP